MSFDLTLKIFSYTRKISISKELLQYSVITAVVITSIAAAYWGTQEILLLLVAGILGIPVLLLLLRYPNLGFILILVGGMFVPYSGPGKVNASILSVILLMGLWFIDMFVVKRKFEFVKSRTLRPAIYFMIISILAFAMGQIPWFVFANQAPLDAQIGGFAIYFFLLATIIMTANLVTNIRWLKIIVWTFVGLGTVYMLGRTVQLTAIDRLYQPGVYTNSMFWMWMVALPLGQVIFNNQLRLRTRILLFGIVTLTLLVALVQQRDWKSGWVPAVVVVGVLLALRFKRLALLSIPFALMVGIYLTQDLISTDTYSWETRIDAWIVVLDISRANPILGLGFANYYWYAKLFPIRGYHIQFNSHSQYVDIIAQTGILGLLCFVWLLYELGRLAWVLKDKVPDGFAKGYVYSIFASVFGAAMAAFLVDWLLPFAYNIGLDGVRASILPWVFFGGLISIEQIYFANNKVLPAK